MSRSADSSAGSRPSQTNCQGGAHPAETPDSEVAPSDLCGRTGLRPLTVDGLDLRPEACVVETPDGYTVPADQPEGPPEGEIRARPWYRVLAEWRDWYKGYESAHITFERGDGKTARTRLTNAYQPEYGDTYYAKLKDLERAVDREYEGLTTAMLTFSASTLNAEGNPRCPADHMREIADGWDTARKRLYEALDGWNWEYVRVWEPTSETGKGPAGYGHLHVAIFVETPGEASRLIRPGRFRPVMEAYTDATPSAHPAAHRADGSAVSIRDGEGLGSPAGYVAEYIGTHGERAVDRPMHEQQFFATTWATGTRRVSFSRGANELLRGERRRRETGTRPGDRGGESGARDGVSDGESDVTELGGSGGGYDPDREWEARCICRVVGSIPNRSDPTTGGIETIATEERSGLDPPREV